MLLLMQKNDGSEANTGIVSAREGTNMFLEVSIMPDVSGVSVSADADAGEAASSVGMTTPFLSCLAIPHQHQGCSDSRTVPPRSAAPKRVPCSFVRVRYYTMS